MILCFALIYTQASVAQVQMTTILNHPYPVESETGVVIPQGQDGQDEAWAGAETSDGGLLAVGSVDQQQAFISRYNMNAVTDINGNTQTNPTRHTRLVPEWNRIMDIKPIGPNRYVIVGHRDGGGGGKGDYPGLGIAFLTDLGAATAASGVDFFELEEFYFVNNNISNPNPGSPVSPLPNNKDKITSSLSGDAEAIFSTAVPSAVVKHFDERLGDIYNVVIHHEGNPSVFILQFTYSSSAGFVVKGVSQRYADLRWPHAIAACGDHLVVAGQTDNAGLVIASWSKDNLTLIGDYAEVDGAPDEHKAKMVACAGPQGVLACGSFQDPDNGQQVKGLDYFPDPAILDDYPVNETPPTPYYSSDDILGFNTWPGQPVSYAQAIAPSSLGGWILAGQSNNDPEVMVAMIVTPDNPNFTNFSVLHFTEPFIGSGGGDSYANYVIELRQIVNGKRRYALFGKANWDGNVGNSYVVIVEEP